MNKEEWEEYITWEERVTDKLERWVKYNKPITREQAEETIDFICEQDNVIDRKIRELERYKNIIDELRWKPIEEYEKPKYDWVLVKYFIEPNFECIPCVAENRFGKWYDRNDNLINGEVRYFADMQLLDTLGELKGE